LFTRGVILVEGETEVGALRRWFNNGDVAGDDRSTLDAQNFMLLSVDGDRNFGPYISYLDAMGVPWVVLADGPALSPSYKHSLLKQFSGTDGSPTVRELLGPEPTASAPFNEWKSFWQRNRVRTVASSFGVKVNGEKSEGDSGDSGEIERFLRELSPELWDEVKAAITSKVRRGYLFAERLDLEKQPGSTAKIKELWRGLLSDLVVASGG